MFPVCTIDRTDPIDRIDGINQNTKTPKLSGKCRQEIRFCGGKSLGVCNKNQSTNNRIKNTPLPISFYRIWSISHKCYWFHINRTWFDIKSGDQPAIALRVLFRRMRLKSIIHFLEEPAMALQAFVLEWLIVLLSAMFSFGVFWDGLLFCFL